MAVKSPPYTDNALVANNASGRGKQKLSHYINIINSEPASPGMKPCYITQRHPHHTHSHPSVISRVIILQNLAFHGNPV